MPKIGLIGAECTGKTTLLELLEPLTSLPIIRELVRDMVESWGYVKPSDVPDVKVAQRAYLEAQCLRQRELVNFISDRTPLDNSAYMVLYAAASMPESSVQQFLSKAREYTEHYDLLLYFPIMWDEIDDDGFRQTDVQMRQATDLIINGLLSDFGLWDLVYVVKSETPEKRLEEVLKVFDERGLRI